MALRKVNNFCGEGLRNILVVTHKKILLFCLTLKNSLCFKVFLQKNFLYDSILRGNVLFGAIIFTLAAVVYLSRASKSETNIFTILTTTRLFCLNLWSRLEVIIICFPEKWTLLFEEKYCNQSLHRFCIKTFIKLRIMSTVNFSNLKIFNEKIPLKTLQSCRVCHFLPL